MNLNKENIERIASIAKALSHPTRVTILNFLSKENTCFFGDISEIIPASKATISQHLKELKNAGLITGEIMPPKSSYCINHEAWKEVKILFGSLIDTCIENNKCGC